MALIDIQGAERVAPSNSRLVALNTAWRFLAEGSVFRLAVGSFLFAAIAMVIWRQLGQAEIGDSAIWDYVAQSILRGQIPYRDVVEIKTPGSAYLSALAMWIARVFGLRDIFGVRVLDVLLVGGLSAVTFAVSQLYLNVRAAAIISFLIPLMSDRFIGWTSGGTEPKLLMVLLGLSSLVFIAKDQPFLAGFASMLSCLCWQPGLLFSGTAFLMFSRYLTSWRDLRALKLLVGSALPLATALLYFYHVGALSQLWTWTIAYTSQVYAPEGARALPDALGHIWRVTSRSLGPGIVIVGAGLAGFTVFLWRRIRAGVKDKQGLASSVDLHRDAIVIAPAVYFLFCLVDFKGGPYLIPLIPFAGIFSAWLLVRLLGLQASILPDRLNIASRISLEAKLRFAAAAIIALALLLAVRSGLIGNTGLREQTRQFQILSDMIGPNDRIYVHGATEILVLLDRPNLNPYIFLDNGKDDYLAARTAGGFKSIVEAMDAEQPRLVALSRLGQVRHRQELEEWVRKSYERIPMIGYEVYLRKAQPE
jgi:hypothetical protein